VPAVPRPVSFHQLLHAHARAGLCRAGGSGSWGRVAGTVRELQGVALGRLTIPAVPGHRELYQYERRLSCVRRERDTRMTMRPYAVIGVVRAAKSTRLPRTQPPTDTFAPTNTARPRAGKPSTSW